MAFKYTSVLTLVKYTYMRGWSNKCLVSPLDVPTTAREISLGLVFQKNGKRAISVSDSILVFGRQIASEVKERLDDCFNEFQRGCKTPLMSHTSSQGGGIAPELLCAVLCAARKRVSVKRFLRSTKQLEPITNPSSFYNWHLKRVLKFPNRAMSS